MNLFLVVTLAIAMTNSPYFPLIKGQNCLYCKSCRCRVSSKTKGASTPNAEKNVMLPQFGVHLGHATPSDVLIVACPVLLNGIIGAHGIRLCVCVCAHTCGSVVEIMLLQ